MKKKFSFLFVGIILVATLLACQFSSLAPKAAPVSSIPTPTISVALPASPASTQGTDLANQQDKLVALYASVNPGVVNIIAGSSLSSNGVYGGSGFVYSTDGYIVTNYHIVTTEKKVEVDFPDGNKVYGDVIGADQNTDLAVIKVDVPSSELHPLALGDSDTLQPGEAVAAIGNPEFLSGSISTGIVSAVGRSHPSIAPVTGQQNSQSGTTVNYAAGDIIQTDALVNHGNSGGPLVNMEGQVMGVIWEMQPDTMTGYPTGIGYAISVNTVKRVVPELIQNGKFAFPYLGITMAPSLPLDIINLLGLKSTTGAYVLSVVAGGPADKAGLKAGTVATSDPSWKSGGDLIIAVDGQPVQVSDDLMRHLVVHKSPGDTATLTVLRGDQKVDVTLTLGARP